ncbi:MAG: AbrB/MazE/SpoVT family DNA-binding domain-containing protein [Thermoplasmatales archaeon]|nr:AbrB/MazE/SpoVT family DNA-binding domain-containing protein [Thermoplasmatales archaeon]
MEIAITKLSSKGQIVIPSEMRKNIPIGEKLFIIRNRNQWILKRVKDIDKNFEDDLKFAKRTEEAFKRYERGEFKEVDGKKFLKMLEKW